MKGARGSYTAYFQRRGGTEDAARRLSYFPSDKLVDKIVLDIGCSSGPRSVLGIDVDRQLVETANNRLQTAKSNYLLADRDYNGTTKKYLVPRVLKKAPPSVSASKTCEGKGYPLNVTFICTTILDNSIKMNSYDTIFCLSVVKWVHLDQGDDGLMDFFYRIHDLLKDDGFLILEYQPWTSYDHAVKNRKQEEIYQNYSQLALRPEHFESILEDRVGFNVISRQGPALCDSKGYHRPVLIAQKQPIIVGSMGSRNNGVKEEEREEKRDDEKQEKKREKKSKEITTKRNRDECNTAIVNSRPKRTNNATYIERNAIFGSSFPTRSQGLATGSWSI